MKTKEVKLLVDKIEEQAITIANQKKEIEVLNQQLKELEKQNKKSKDAFEELNKQFLQLKMQFALMDIPDAKCGE